MCPHSAHSTVLLLMIIICSCDHSLSTFWIMYLVLLVFMVVLRLTLKE